MLETEYIAKLNVRAAIQHLKFVWARKNVKGNVNPHARIKACACAMGRANAKVASMARIVAKNLML